MSNHQLVRLSIVGGFLDGQTFELHPRLNAVIGARGTGKTTILELLRYGLDCLPTDQIARKRVEDLVAKNLRGGRVDIVVRTADGLDYTVSRAAGEDPIVTTADGRVTGMSVRSGLFRPDVFSQNEVELIADRSLSQLDLVDAFAEDAIADLNRQVDEARSGLVVNAAALKPLRVKAIELEQEMKTLPAVEERLRAYGDEGGEDAEVINRAHFQKAMRDRESRAMTKAKSQVDELGKAVVALTGRLEAGIPALGLDEFSGGPNAEMLVESRRLLAETGTALDEGLTWMADRLRSSRQSLVDLGERLSLAHKEQEVAFQRLLERHEAARTKAGERAGLDRTRNDLMAKGRDLEQVRFKVASLEKERDSLLDRLSELRDRRYQIRAEVAAKITERVAPVVRVTVVQYGNPATYRELIEAALARSGVRQGQVAERVVASLSPEELAAAVRVRDRQVLREKAALNDNQADRLLERLGDEDRLAELEAVELIDRPVIELSDNGTWKETSVLSTGQKCTAILPILLLDSDTPLLIDQPEDNLDNRFVYETVVTSIRRVKTGRQLLFVTHNPNIPVLGEAERVFVMESDGLAGRIRREGDVDTCQEDIVTLLEGGKDAFKRRHDRYRY